MVIDEKQTDQMEDEKTLSEPEEAVPVPSRGVARKNARRARGRRGAASRARVVNTRIHSGRRQPVVPPTTSNEENNAILEETINTETEESPKKETSDSNVRVSGKEILF